jgi:hypothetical protein
MGAQHDGSQTLTSVDNSASKGNSVPIAFKNYTINANQAFGVFERVTKLRRNAIIVLEVVIVTH